MLTMCVCRVRQGPGGTDRDHVTGVSIVYPLCLLQTDGLSRSSDQLPSCMYNFVGYINAMMLYTQCTLQP